MAEVIVAMDVPGRTSALTLVDRLGPEADFVKVGLELFAAGGPEVVRELRSGSRKVFLDLKLHDIPNTVAGAARVAADLGVALLTVHSAGGGAMLCAAREAVEGTGTRLLAVTVLTSLTQQDVQVNWGRGELCLEDEVIRLAKSSIDSGAHGVVASPAEAEILRRELGPGVLIVTPGIRLPGENMHDQRRVATPAEAARAGVDYIVVGRTVTQASDPRRALARVRSDMQGEAT